MREIPTKQELKTHDNLTVVSEAFRSVSRSNELYETIIRQYWRRPYHNIDHIAEMLLAASRFTLDKSSREILTRSIIFHDIIQPGEQLEFYGYKYGHGHDNDSPEMASARFGADRSRLKIQHTVLETILATDYTAPANYRFRGYSGLARMIRDLDLMGLAAQPQTFKLNTRKVWEEMSPGFEQQVSWENFLIERRRILMSIVERDANIFASFGNHASSMLHETLYNIKSLGPGAALTLLGNTP